MLKDRIALVTGGSHGLGRAIALALAGNGASLIICARTPAGLADTDWAIRQIAPASQVFCSVTDATQPAQIRHLFTESVASHFQRLDILINNVGGAESFGGFMDLTDQDWHAAYELNLMSMVRFCREAIPWLKRSPAGRIINLSSFVASQPGRYNPHHSAAKAAVLNLSKFLANDLAKDNILVNAICPDTIKGGGWDRNVADRAQRDQTTPAEAAVAMEAECSRKVPLGRIGHCADVAELVVFLCSDRANFLTGGVYNIDGGRRASML